MININFNGVKNSFGTINLINFNIGLPMISLDKTEKNPEKYDLEKRKLISSLNFFYSHPDFEVNCATMDKELTNSFYNVAIKLTYDLNFTDSQFGYFKENLFAHNVNNKLDLIEFLIKERDFLKQNDSRYTLGFRSIYAVINNNFENIDYKYLTELNKMLTPFFISYKHKELLISEFYL